MEEENDDDGEEEEENKEQEEQEEEGNEGKRRRVCRGLTRLLRAQQLATEKGAGPVGRSGAATGEGFTVGTAASTAQHGRHRPATHALE